MGSRYSFRLDAIDAHRSDTGLRMSMKGIFRGMTFILQMCKETIINVRKDRMTARPACRFS